VVRKSTWLPNGAAGRRRGPHGDREPGADHDYMAREYPTGPAVTPLGDLLTAVLCVVGAVLVLVVSLAMAGGALVLGALLLVIVVMLVFLGGGGFLVQRGVRRWAWRRSHIERTGGVYLRPWQRTPDAYRGGWSR